MSRPLHQLLVRPGVRPNFFQPSRQFYNEIQRSTKKDPHSPLYHLLQGLKMFKTEWGRFVEEWREKLKVDRARYYAEQIVPQYRFKHKEAREAFHVVADSDYKIGFSSGDFIATQQGTGLFKGFLDTRVPRDGKTQRSGYVVLQGLPKTKSFQRQVYLDWELWTHLVIRCRGDGRQYFINLTVYEEDDLTIYVLYQYPLFTRGGPYWQITKIPFSKFFLTFKGSIQDKQNRIDLSKVTKIGIALMDKTPGPFELEIDYIACIMSESDPEIFAYETYETPEGYGHAYGT